MLHQNNGVNQERGRGEMNARTRLVNTTGEGNPQDVIKGDSKVTAVMCGIDIERLKGKTSKILICVHGEFTYS